MKRIVLFSTLLYWLLTTIAGQAQQISTNTVKFKVTYDKNTDRYTAWVVPDYNVPNANNSSLSEYGGTAQFTLKVPTSFSIVNIQDIKGTWEKSPQRLGPGNVGTWPGLDPAYNYYVIGKGPSETNYGTFQAGMPVALFSFQGVACVGPVSPLPPGDPFISIADSQASLNVANSFYSRSGQPSGGNVVPFEQFINLTGNPADCRPISAIADSQTMTVGTSTTIAVLTNDLNKGQPAIATNVSVTLTTPPSTGTAIINADKTISYSPPAGFTGVVSFTYTICDIVDPMVCSSAPVTITVVSPAPPRQILAYDDNGIGIQGGIITGEVVSNDDLRNGVAPLVVTTTPLTQPAHGTVTLNQNGGYSYQPTPDFSGTDFFVYQICDSGSSPVCATATVTLKVQPTPSSTNNSPIALTDNFSTKISTSVSGNVLTNDKDPDPGQLLTVSTTPVLSPNNGSITLNSNGTFTYIPNPGFSGVDYFTYQVCDNGSPQKCDQARARIVVFDPLLGAVEPVANSDLFFRLPTAGVSGDVIPNDSDPAGLSLTVTTTPIMPPTNGSVTLNANGTFTYTPNVGYKGDDQFTYEICNTDSKCSQAIVFIIANLNSVSINTDTDIRVKKYVSVPIGQTVAMGNSVSYSIVVSNIGPNPATGIEVTDLLPNSLSLISSTTDQGNYVSTTGLWTVGSLAVGQSATLVIVAKLLVTGVVSNEASVSKLDQQDPNPTNNTSSACVSVPITICNSEVLVLSIPATYQSVQWFYNGQLIPGQSGASIQVTLPGEYTFQAQNSTCPETGCCPLIIVPGDCCPTICVPVSMIKRKK